MEVTRNVICTNINLLIEFLTGYELIKLALFK